MQAKNKESENGKLPLVIFKRLTIEDKQWTK